MGLGLLVQIGVSKLTQLLTLLLCILTIWINLVNQSPLFLKHLFKKTNMIDQSAVHKQEGK